MRRYTTTQRPVRHPEADIAFHRVIREASGNEMYAVLGAPTAEVLPTPSR